VDVVHPNPASRLRAAVNLASGVAHYRTRFATPENRRLLQAAYRGHDVTFVSWEPLDILAPSLPASPIILIAHNVTSLALPQLFPGKLVAGIAGRQAAMWEKRLYRSPNIAAIVTLSRRDQAHVAGVTKTAMVPLVIPGMPQVVPLLPQAGLREELVVSGTFDWRPKRRDIMLFAQEYARERGRLPVFADRLPDEASAMLPTMPALSESEASEAIRFGLISDRFVAGHKLKTLSYIAHNQVVLSFSDAVHDFESIPDHEFFIRRIASTADIATQVAAVSAVGTDQIRERLLTFQRLCAQQFSWEEVGSRLIRVAQEAVGAKRAEINVQHGRQ
jgi:hypothetical protein